MTRLALATILIFLLFSSQAQALTAQEILPDPDKPSVILITFGPGEIFYEKFGHNAIWIHDPNARYPDVAFNYGVFDFQQKNFIWNFIQGRMTYRIEAADALEMIDVYSKSDRSIWLQGLNLDPDQIASLEKFLIWNVQPANQNYKYDYYYDNCSTKVRDAIDGVIEHQIQEQTSSEPSGTTFRWHTRRLAADAFPLYAALDYVMGHAIDREISKWEEMFLAVRMSEHFRQVKVSGAPLVRWEKDFYTSRTHSERSEPPNWFWVFLLIGLAIGGSLALGARWLTPSPGTPGEGWGEGSGEKSKRSRESKKSPHPNPLPEYRVRGLTRRALRGLLFLIALAWVLLAGLGGAISTWAWFFTDHVAAKSNENLLQLNPITLAMIVLLPLAVFTRKWAKNSALYIAAIGLGLSILGFVLQILPNWNQPNGQIIALAMPAHAGLAWAMYQIFKSQPVTEKKAQLATSK